MLAQLVQMCQMIYGYCDLRGHCGAELVWGSGGIEGMGWGLLVVVGREKVEGWHNAGGKGVKRQELGWEEEDARGW